MSPASSAPVDLRSDTFTTPDQGMRRAMAAAEVGDDVWGEDPTVRALEEEVAGRLGKAAAVFVPSGTMGNLASLAAQTRPGERVVVDVESHVVVHEAGGAGAVAGVMLHTIDATGAAPTPDQIRESVPERDIHHPVATLLWLENTHGGRSATAVPRERIEAAASVAHQLGLRVHCDGARLFNAATALSLEPAALVSLCDSVSVCLSKGLGAPVGSVVAADSECIQRVRAWRKRLGGGMRQAGILAAAGLYALQHHVARLADDHAHAALIASRLRGLPAASLIEVEHPTNMVMLETTLPAERIIQAAHDAGVLISAVGSHRVRCVTHKEIDETAARRAADALGSVFESREAQLVDAG